MALKGKIGEFGIADILQLIGQQQRSGILTMHSNKSVSKLTFVNGMVSEAHPPYLSPKTDPLGDCVVKARLITEDDLQRAIKKQEKTLKSLEEVLLEWNFLSGKQIQNVSDSLIFETLYDVLQWKSGDYEFIIKEIDHDERFGSLLSIEHLLLDVFRMIDEEPELSRKVPSYDITFQKSTPGEEESDELNIKEELSHNERIVYKFVNGTNTVQDIIDQSLLGRYDTAKALANLLDAGIIKKISEAGRVAPQKILPRKNVFTYISYGVLPAIILLLLGLKLIVKTPPPSDDIDLFSPEVAIAKTRFLKITNVLQVYFLEHGSFPESLEELAKGKLLSPEEINFPPEVKYRYSLQEDGSYQLE